MQGFGQLLCATTLVILSNAFGSNYEGMWRAALAVGGLPMAIAFYFRWNMLESEQWEKVLPNPVVHIHLNSTQMNTNLFATSKLNVSQRRAHLDAVRAATDDSASGRSHSEDSSRSSNNSSRSKSSSGAAFQYLRDGIRFVVEAVSENWWSLLGTAGAWFILDVVFYANGLFSGQITSTMGLGSSIRAEALIQVILQVP